MAPPPFSFGKMKSEYHEPKTLPGERAVPSIRIDAGRLLKLLLRAELMMNAVDRRRYASRAIDVTQDVIAEFALAYDFDEDRLYHLKRMWGRIAVLLEIMRIIGETNAIRVKPQYETMTPDQMKLELFNTVARLDEGATKWKKTVLQKQRNKGKLHVAGRNEQSPDE